MPTFKPIIRHQKKDGSYNVTIRLTHNRESRYIKTPYFVSSSEVTKRKRNGKEEIKIKNQAVLDNVDEVILGYKKKILGVGIGADSWDVDRMVKFLTSSPESFTLDFIEYGRRFVESIRSEGRESTARQYGLAISALIRFLGRKSLDVSEINYSFLKSFENHLRNEPTYKGIRSGESVKTNIPKKGRALSLYMSHLKTMYERAKDEYNDEECGIINIPYSPFKKYQIPKMLDVVHRTLTIEHIQQIIDLVKSGKFDYILIEASGICEPMPIVQTIAMMDGTVPDSEIPPIVRLDGVISVVDALRLRDEFASGERLMEDNGEDDIENLLVEQIEFCSTIVINKIDEVGEEDLKKVRAVVRALQPKAKLIETNYAKVDLSDILNTNQFDYDKTFSSAGWIAEFEKDEEEEEHHHHDEHECHCHEEGHE